MLKIDADAPENEDVMNEYDVRSIPTLVLLDENDKVLGRVIGQKSEPFLQDWIDSFVD